MSDRTLAPIDLRDLARVETFARETLRQCEFLRRNGDGDEIRWGFIADDLFKAWKIAARADRRAAKKQGWATWRWRIPRGYAA